jgi:C-terminal processing protease CtpA/Prc
MKKYLLLLIAVSLTCTVLPSAPKVSEDNWELFKQVFSLVLDTYVEPKTSDELIAGAFEGLAISTGPECGYIPKSKIAEIEQAKKSEGFLPLYITKDGGFANVIAPFSGEDKEIESGDMLRFINGKSVFDMNYPQLIVALKGSAGEEVTCGFIKKGTFKPFEKKLVKKKAIQPVFHELKGGGSVLEIPCIEAEWDDTLKDKVAKAAGKIIVDLRGCASSDTGRAAYLSGLLFGAGALRFDSKDGETKIPFDGAGLLKGREVITVVDKTTARGGEMLALAASDKGPVIGEETYGFSALHETLTLKNGDALVILTGYFLGKDGKEIKSSPVKPDTLYDVSERSRKDDFYLKIMEKGLQKEKNGSH